MPHKIKQTREQQHHRRLPHAEEEPLRVEQDVQDGNSCPGHNALSSTSANNRDACDASKKKMGAAETLSMEDTCAKIETSPLPLGRALLSSVTGRKCGPSTPVPSWKMYDSPFQGTMDPANNSDANPRLLMRGLTARQSGCPRNGVSARKLAAFLWDMQGSLNSHHHRGKPELKAQHHEDLVNREHPAKGKEGMSEQVMGVASHGHHSRKVKEGSSRHQKRRTSPRKQLHPHGIGSSPPCEVEDSNVSTPIMKVSWSTDVDAAQPSGEDGSTLSCELLKVLNQIWSMEEQHNQSTTTVASLRSELKTTKARIKELQEEQRSYHGDLEMLNKKLEAEKRMLKGRAEEAVLAAIQPFKEELETERKSKLKLESKHKKLAMEMNEVKKTVTKTMQEFEKEQKARELMEDVCDELAREIGEDKAQVEELKRQSAKYREEVEQERRMLQMAEVWREERVHMKLAEARFELEEKNAALDKLRGELEAFLRVKRSLDEVDNGGTGNLVPTAEQSIPLSLRVSDKHIQGGQQPSKNSMAVFMGEKRSRDAVGKRDGEDSPDDDLHSIELNRASYSGSQEGHSSAHGISVNSKSVTNGKPALNDTKIPISSFPPSADEVADGNMRELSNFSLDRVVATSGNAAMAESITNEIQEVDSQVVGRGSERSGLKDWDLGKRPVSWSSEGLRGHDNRENSVRLNVKGRSGLGQMDTYSLSRSSSKGKCTGVTMSSLDLHADGENSKRQVFDLARHHSSEVQSGDGLSSLSRQVATFPSSPTRKWAYSWPSPDPNNNNKAGQPVESIPKGFKDNSLKARLLEAKLESQQAKLKDRKVDATSFS